VSDHPPTQPGDGDDHTDPATDDANPPPPAGGNGRPSTPFTPDQPRIASFYYAWAQAEATRSVQLAMALAGYADAASAEGVAGAQVVSGTSDDELRVYATGGDNVGEPRANAHAEMEALPLLPESFSPQQSELLGAALSLDVDAFGEGMMRFFARLDELGNEMLAGSTGVRYLPWLIPILAAGAALEMMRRRRRPALESCLADAARDASWTWSMGISDSPISR
jgi:hypothetical protein